MSYYLNRPNGEFESVRNRISKGDDRSFAWYGVTSHLSIDFLRRPAATGLIVRSRILRLGRKSANFAVEVFSQSDPDRLVAHASGAYALFESAAPEAG